MNAISASFIKVSFFAILIFLGILLNRLINNSSLKNTLKFYILNAALPITIFISLISIKIDNKYLLYPIYSLIFNLLILTISPIILKISGLKNVQKKKTLTLLLPSFAPGLSSFAIINEFLGYNSLAEASIIDVGNKIFVLLILFFIAIRYHKKNRKIDLDDGENKIGSIFKNFLYEPINIVIIVALIFFLTNNSIIDIPNLIVSFFNVIKRTLAPAVFIFVGLSILLEKKYFFEIIPILMIRAGICLLLALSIILIGDLKINDKSILYIILSLSSVSFWPFSHMTFIEKLEKKLPKQEKTFDLKYALIFLAYSLPFSTIIILSLFFKKTILYEPINLLTISFLLIMIGLIIFSVSKKIN